MTTSLKTAFTADEWEPLPGGWVLYPFASLADDNQHLIPRVPVIDGRGLCCPARAPIGTSISYWCTRPHGHDGRHAACVQDIKVDKTLRVVAVWKEAT